MKRKLMLMTGMALGAALAILGFAGVAHAQEKVIANIPFDFVVGSERLPAGRYTISETEDPGLLLVQDTTHRHAMFVITIGAIADKPAGPELIFEHAGADYFLTTIANGTDEREIVVKKRPIEERVSTLVTVPMTIAER